MIFFVENVPSPNQDHDVSFDPTRSHSKPSKTRDEGTGNVTNGLHGHDNMGYESPSIITSVTSKHSEHEGKEISPYNNGLELRCTSVSQNNGKLFFFLNINKLNSLSSPHFNLECHCQYSTRW